MTRGSFPSDVSKDPLSGSQGQRRLSRVHVRFATLRAIVALVLREISTTYGRNPGGYVWAVLEPAAGIALLTLIFSAGFRSPPLGTDFAYFYAGALLPFLLYLDISNKLSQTLQFSRALLSYPRVTFVDALIARLLLNTLTQLVVNGVIFGFIVVFLEPDVTVDLSKVFVAYVMTITLAMGIGTMNCFLTVAYPVWQTIWAIFNRPLFLASCLFFLFESVPSPYSDFLWFNPLVHIVGAMRDGYFPFYNPTYVSVSYPILIGLALTTVGLFLLNRYHQDILVK